MDSKDPLTDWELEAEVNLSLDTGIERFLRIVGSWGAGTRYYKKSAFGVRRGENATILQARVIISPAPFDETPPIPLDAKPYWAASEAGECNSKELLRMVREVSKGYLDLSSFDAELFYEEGRPLALDYYPTTPPAFHDDPTSTRMPALRVSGETRRSILARVVEQDPLDWKLRASDPPFADLDDVLGYFGLPSMAQAGEKSHIEVWLRSPVMIDQRSSFEGSTATARLSAARSIDRKKVVLGYRGIGGSKGVVRGRIFSSAGTWGVKEGRLEGEFKIEVGDAVTVQFFLTYDAMAIQQWWVANPERHVSPRYALHSAFDPRLTMLKRLALETKKTETRNFEDGVAILLGLLGFSVTQFGRHTRLSDGPDILAYTPAGRVLVVQCTLGQPNQGDTVERVLRRAETARKALAAADWPGVRVLPAIVTALSESDLESQIADAEKRGVAVAAFETVYDAFDQASIIQNPDELFRRIADRLAVREPARK